MGCATSNHLSQNKVKPIVSNELRPSNLKISPNSDQKDNILTSKLYSDHIQRSNSHS